MTIQEAYQILGLSGHPGAEEVRQAYRQRALQWHPDKFDEGKKEYFAKKFMEARTAYDFLREQGYPDLAPEPLPEPGYSPKAAGRRFAPKEPAPDPGRLSDKMREDFSLSLESILLWALVPLGIAGLWWIYHFLWIHLH